MLFRIIYLSCNAVPGDAEAVERTVAELLEISRRNNAAAQVSGVLLFNSGAFLQVLEGPMEAVEATFERIQRDRRHADVIVLEAKPVEERRFADWAMAFVGSDAGDRTRYAALALDPQRALLLGGERILGLLEAMLAREERRAAA